MVHTKNIEVGNREHIPHLDIRHVRKSRQEREVLKGLSLSLPRGTVTAVIGPSGAGKTTLLRCINQLTSIDSGEIMLGGRVIAQGGAARSVFDNTLGPVFVRQQIGLVFQEWNLWPNLTVQE